MGCSLPLRNLRRRALCPWGRLLEKKVETSKVREEAEVSMVRVSTEVLESRGDERASL